MTKDFDKYRWGNTRAAIFLRNKIDESRYQQREIAAAMGYENANVLSMIKRGEAKIPLEKIPALARILDVDMASLTQMVLEQIMPGEERKISEMFSKTITKNQREWLNLIQDATGEQDPTLTPSFATAVELALDIAGESEQNKSEKPVALALKVKA